MKVRSSHRFIGFEVAMFFTLIALAVLWLPAPHSTAQQDNRQLKRDQTQPNGAAPRRTALVIGNGHYQLVSPLDNPVNDATDIAAALQDLGFEVIEGTDTNLVQMRRLIREFGERLEQKKGIGLFYFAGHGIEVRGKNFLVPVDADIARESETEDYAIDVNAVLRRMDGANNGFNIVILDACRNNPFSRGWNRSGETGGLANINAPTGTYIAFAAAPGSTASDGKGTRNGIFTGALLKNLKRPNLKLEEVFKATREEVMTLTDSKQVPWDSSSVKGDFYFSISVDLQTQPNSTTAVPKPTPLPTPTPMTAQNFDAEWIYWQEISRRDTRSGYELYIAEYPGGKHAAEAANKIDKFKQDELRRLKDIERAKWHEDQSLNTKDAYQAYLSAYPNGEFAADARSGIKALETKEERAKWLAMQRLDTKDAYQSYLMAYPYGEFAADARSGIKALESKEEQAKWDEVQILNRKTAFQSYLSAYPSGKYAAVARQRIGEFDAAEATAQREREKVTERVKWEEAERLKTIEAYDGYLTSYPNGDYASLARLRLSNMGVSRSPVEETDWQEINSRGMRPDYERYLSKYPDGKYTSTARQKIKELEDGEKKEERRKELEKVNELLGPIENDFNNRRYRQVVQASIALLQNVSVRHGRINFLLGMSYWNTGDFGKSVLPLSHSIEEGETVTVTAKRFAFVSTGDVHTSLVEGKLVLKKGSLEFITFWTGGPNRGEVYARLSVPASKIYALEYGDFMFQLSIPTPHIRIKIGVPKGNNNSKEDKINYDFQPTGATMISCQAGAWCATCSGCQEEAKAIYGLILSLKNGQ